MLEGASQGPFQYIRGKLRSRLWQRRSPLLATMTLV